METVIYKSYTPSQKKAILKYRETHKDDYKESQHEYYLKRKEDPDFKEKKKESNRQSYLRRKELKNKILIQNPSVAKL
jgi:hypothetical protein